MQQVHGSMCFPCCLLYCLGYGCQCFFANYARADLRAKYDLL